jgi:hypothetical protein
VQIEDSRAGIVTLDPDLWFEAAVKVDHRATVVLQVWDRDAGENLSLRATVEPGRWTTLGGPLRTFGDASGHPRAKPVRSGDKGTCLSVFAGQAGETVELLVDDVRLWMEK